jgi:nucleotide-binding universal stress UspA family protein
MDGSRQSAKDLTWQSMSLQKYGAAIRILRVVTFSMLDIAWKTPNTGGPLIKKDYLKEAEQRDKKTMTAVRSYLRANVRKAILKGVEASYSVMVGDPAESIKTCSRKEKVDLIVMKTPR